MRAGSDLDLMPRLRVLATAADGPRRRRRRAPQPAARRDPAAARAPPRRPERRRARRAAQRADLSDVTVRAEVSRLRRIVGPLLSESRPYRLTSSLRTDADLVRELLAAGDIEAALSTYPGPVLARSVAPGIERAREELSAELRAAVLASSLARRAEPVGGVRRGRRRLAGVGTARVAGAARHADARPGRGSARPARATARGAPEASVARDNDYPKAATVLQPPDAYRFGPAEPSAAIPAGRPAGMWAAQSAFRTTGTREGRVPVARLTRDGPGDGRRGSSPGTRGPSERRARLIASESGAVRTPEQRRRNLQRCCNHRRPTVRPDLATVPRPRAPAARRPPMQGGAMTVYAAPGQPGSLGHLSASRYDHWIGGEYVAPASGRYFENPSPVNGKTFCEVARGDAADIDRALDAAHGAARSWGKTSETERAQRPQQDRRPHRGEHRDARRGRDVGERQADPRDRRRGHAAGRRPLPLLRGRDPRAGGVDLADRRRHGRVPLPRAARRGRPDHPVELPDAHGHLEARARARGRQLPSCSSPPSRRRPRSSCSWSSSRDLLPPGVVNVVNGFGAEAGKPLASSPRIAKIAFTGETTTGG